MSEILTTDRLLIEPLTQDHNEFIFELVNSPGWLKFIGNRNVNSAEEAKGYIQKIIDNPNVRYKVVKRKTDNVSTGVITFIRRDYLAHHDIGFAFLPAHEGQGYAYEATRVVLSQLLTDYSGSHVLATTVPENARSVTLLRKLGLEFEKEIVADNTKLDVYSIQSDKLRISEITKLFFSVFTNKNQRKPDFDVLRRVCLPEVLIISKAWGQETMYTLSSFIEPRKKILTDGTLVDFEEHELDEKTTISNHIAQRHSHYAKSGVLSGTPFEQKGTKFFQFVKTKSGWKISAVIWQDEPGN